MKHAAWMLLAACIAASGTARTEAGDRKVPGRTETRSAGPTGKSSQVPTRKAPVPKASTPRGGRKAAVLDRKALGLGCSSGED